MRFVMGWHSFVKPVEVNLDEAFYWGSTFSDIDRGKLKNSSQTSCLRGV